MSIRCEKRTERRLEMTKVKPRTALIKARKKAGITQKELADKVGIDRAFYSNIERGKYAPSLNVAYEIAKVLGSTIESLFFNNYVRKTNKKVVSA
jgi:putative transcriptional regulator